MQMGKAHIIIRKHQDATMKNNKYFLLLIISILALSAIRCSAADALTGDDQALTAGLNEISGTVRILNPTAGELVDASNGSQIESGDQVVTDVDSRVRVDISDGTIIRVGPLSSFTLTDIGNQDGKLKGSFRLDVGSLWIILKGGEVKVDTPSGLASVRGSYLYIFVHPGEKNTFVTCLEGECELVNSVGKVKMVAGQTAKVINSKTDPELGQMSAEDVANWLKINPEATDVIIPLTKTVEASKKNEGNNGNGNGNGNDKDKDKDNDDDDDAVVATATSTMTPSPTNTPTAIDCGPPEGWILHTLVNDEDIFTLAKAFQVEVEAIQKANCMGESTSTVPGIGLYMPDVATITPTPTNTNTPTKTPVPPTNTNTPVPATATNTPIPPTATATDSPATFTYYAGPNGGPISQCVNGYEVNVTDADGIASVKIIYSTSDNTLATKDGSIDLQYDGGTKHYKTNDAIPTFANGGTDTVWWRFEMTDNRGVTYVDVINSFSDSNDCDQDTSFLDEIGPTSTIVSCANTYQVDVDDTEGISFVKIQYAVNDAGFVSPSYLDLSYKSASGANAGYDIYELVGGSITAAAGDTVYWRFKVEDLALKHVLSSTTNSYISIDCP